MDVGEVVDLNGNIRHRCAGPTLPGDTDLRRGEAFRGKCQNPAKVHRCAKTENIPIELLGAVQIVRAMLAMVRLTVMRSVSSGWAPRLARAWRKRIRTKSLSRLDSGSEIQLQAG